jgi:phosphopantetheinyl transferase
MGYIYTNHNDTHSVGLWHITESEAELKNSLLGSLNEETPAIENAQARLHYWGSRAALIHLGGETIVHLQHDSFGKLYTPQMPQTHLSISHGNGFAAAIISSIPCGVDVEVMNGRIAKVAHKFVNVHEQQWVANEEDLYKTWCAKEVIYKIYGQKEVDFREHLFIDQPRSDGTWWGMLQKQDIEMRCQLFYHYEKNTLLVWGLLFS